MLADIPAKQNLQRPSATVDDVGRAIVYEVTAAQIASAAAMGPAAAPPWFEPVQQQLNNMQLQLNDIDNRLNNMDNRLNNMNNRLNQIDVKASRAFNGTNAAGVIYPFEIVLFVDGTNPTAHPHNLPPLTSITIIDNLQGFQATRYLNGYGIEPIPQRVAERLRVLKTYLGCGAP